MYIYNVEDSEYLYMAGGNENSVAALEKSLIVPQKIKDRVFI